jgi:hypothetical protein
VRTPCYRSWQRHGRHARGSRAHAPPLVKARGSRRPLKASRTPCRIFRLLPPWGLATLPAPRPPVPGRASLASVLSCEPHPRSLCAAASSRPGSGVRRAMMGACPGVLVDADRVRSWMPTGYERAGPRRAQ